MDYSNFNVRPGHSLDEAMQSFVDAAWQALSPQGVSWIGFYFKVQARDEMVLGYRRDKPACSPIGLHGVCGQSFTQERSIVVRDVKVLGAGYVACDPRDQSEVVVPLFDAAGACTGVLDADSFDVGAFAAHDAAELERLLIAAGLTSRRPAKPTLLL